MSPLQQEQPATIRGAPAQASSGNASVFAAPILAAAGAVAGHLHEEELLRSLAAEDLLSAALLNSHPPLVDAVAHVGQHS